MAGSLQLNNRFVTGLTVFDAYTCLSGSITEFNLDTAAVPVLAPDYTGPYFVVKFMGFSSVFTPGGNKIGVGRKELTQLIAVNNPSGALNNKYWLLDAPGTVGYYIWYNSSGAGTDPAPSGTRIGLEVVIADNDLADANAAATAAVLPTVDFLVTTDAASLDTLLILNQEKGAVSDASDGGTDFTLTVLNQGLDNITAGVVLLATTELTALIGAGNNYPGP